MALICTKGLLQVTPVLIGFLVIGLGLIKMSIYSIYMARLKGSSAHPSGEGIWVGLLYTIAGLMSAYAGFKKQGRTLWIVALALTVLSIVAGVIGIVIHLAVGPELWNFPGWVEPYVSGPYLGLTGGALGLTVILAIWDFMALTRGLGRDPDLYRAVAMTEKRIEGEPAEVL